MESEKQKVVHYIGHVFRVMKGKKIMYEGSREGCQEYIKWQDKKRGPEAS